MPNRMLRDWTNSYKVDTISIQAELFFVRLIMKVDDYGCFYADHRLLKANLFPLRIDKIREADIPRWIAECEKAGLIVLYESSNKQYLQILDFRQRLDRAKSKFPLPIDNKPVNESREVVNESPPEVEREVEQKGKEREQPAHEHDLKESNLYRKPNIPTKNQVLEAITAAGGTKEMAKSFWLKHEATGWYTNGSPIKSYAAMAQRFVANWQGKETETPKAPPLRPLT